MPDFVPSGGVYTATPITLSEGQQAAHALDVIRNQIINLGNALRYNLDSITTWPKGFSSVVLTASGQILAGPGIIGGFYVNSTSGGTVRVSDALTATTPYLGAAATPAVGWHTFPANLATGGYVTIAGTIDVTYFVLLFS